MLWTIFVILLILWLLGFSFHIRRRSDPPFVGHCRRGPGHQPDQRPSDGLIFWRFHPHMSPHKITWKGKEEVL